MSDAGNEVWGGMLPELPAPANIDVDIPEFSPMCTRAEATELIEERLGPLIARLDQHENRIAQLENEVLRLQHENANLRRGPVAFEEQRCKEGIWLRSRRRNIYQGAALLQPAGGC